MIFELFKALIIKYEQGLGSIATTEEGSELQTSRPDRAPAEKFLWQLSLRNQFSIELSSRENDDAGFGDLGVILDPAPSCCELFSGTRFSFFTILSIKYNNFWELSWRQILLFLKWHSYLILFFE